MMMNTTKMLLLGVLLASIGCAVEPTEPDGTDGTSADGKADGPTCQSTEVCDGVADEDCDGVVDEGCGRCPLMTVACASGCCPIDSFQVATDSTTGSDIAVDGAGNIYFAYTVVLGTPWQATLAIYDAVPGTWRHVPLGGGSHRNRIRIDGMGRVFVASASDANPHVLSYRRSDDHGVTFSAPIDIGILDVDATFDMEIDSAGNPHFVYAGVPPYGGMSDIKYAHLVGGSWSTEILDTDTKSGSDPDLQLGFADRPHIVYTAYRPPGATGEGKRYVFFNGNRWIGETVDIAGSSSYTGDHFFSAATLRLLPNGSREVLFGRHDGASGDHLILARRGPLDSDTWQQTTITGAAGAKTTTMFVDQHGKRGAVADGVRLLRAQSATTWTSTALGVIGHDVAVARRGRYLYLGYSANASLGGPPTVKVVDLGVH